MTKTSTTALRVCLHCGAAAPAGTDFCCAGCAAVHALLSAQGLAHFYELRDTYSFRRPAPVASVPTPLLPAEVKQSPRARLYIEGIHCLGCLWLLEKLPELKPDVRRASLDIHTQILSVEIDRQLVTWEQVLELLASLGYPAQLLRSDEQASEARRRDQRRQLTRLAVTGFCAGNIMLMTVSLYAGADASWATLFRAISAGLALPTLTYGAWPLYRAAFGALRRGRISVDLPIVLALLAGVALSIASLVLGASDVYFDSLSMLVFLLLASRYLLARYRESMGEASPYLAFVSGERYERGGATVRAEELKPGESLTLRFGQCLPVDAVVMDPEVYVDLSLLTGESAPVKFRRGDQIEAGARALRSGALFRVERPVGTSRLQRILDQIKSERRLQGASLDFADRMGRYFVFAVIGLGAANLLWHAGSDFAEGLRRTLALAIVTCPCVLALAVPLALTRSLQRAAARGILVRGADKVEALAAAKEIFLDKTGTVTTGNYEVLRFETAAPLEVMPAVLALELKSAHPVAKAIVRYLEDRHVAPAPVKYVEEVPGQGVLGSVRGEAWSVVRSLESGEAGENRVDVLRGTEIVGRIALGDSLRPEAPFVVDTLRQLGLEPTLLSGDAPANVELVAQRLGIRTWYGRLTPEEKAAVLRTHPGAVMVGDGANDAIAFRAAAVGIALQGAVDLSLQNSDLVVTKPSLTGLLDALWESRNAMRLVRQNFAFTLAYNTLAGLLALEGKMSPLLAAILMPLSALTVFTYTQLRTRRSA